MLDFGRPAQAVERKATRIEKMRSFRAMQLMSSNADVGRGQKCVSLARSPRNSSEEPTKPDIGFEALPVEEIALDVGVGDVGRVPNGRIETDGVGKAVFAE